MAKPNELQQEIQKLIDDWIQKRRFPESLKVICHLTIVYGTKNGTPASQIIIEEDNPEKIHKMPMNYFFTDTRMKSAGISHATTRAIIRKIQGKTAYHNGRAHIINTVGDLLSLSYHSFYVQRAGEGIKKALKKILASANIQWN